MVRQVCELTNDTDILEAVQPKHLRITPWSIRKIYSSIVQPVIFFKQINAKAVFVLLYEFVSFMDIQSDATLINNFTRIFCTICWLLLKWALIPKCCWRHDISAKSLIKMTLICKASALDEATGFGNQIKRMFTLGTHVKWLLLKLFRIVLTLGATRFHLLKPVKTSAGALIHS